MISPDSEAILRQAREVVEYSLNKNGISEVEELPLNRPEFPPPDLSAGMPDDLWWNLSMDPSMRENLLGEAFYTSNSSPLQLRLETLTESTINAMYHINASLLNSILDVLEGIGDTKLPSIDGKENVVYHRDEGRFTNLFYGFALAVEAYQIASDKHIIAGFDNFSSDEDVLKFLEGQLPDDSWWNMAKIRQMVVTSVPRIEDMGVYNDAKQIARYASRNPVQIGSGAWATSHMLRTYWAEISSEELPPYQPGPYADLDRKPKGLK